MKKTLAVAAAAALLASACATPVNDAPVSNSLASASPLSLGSAAHWNALARDVAQQLSIRLPQGSALFVNQHVDASAFDRAFSTQLITSLIDAGHPVLRTPAGLVPFVTYCYISGVWRGRRAPSARWSKAYR